ncbi:MAG: T9SS type A sorting domain-containing protein [Bacteroidetes bacterium]|nr:T9SS type A sorting domain-containing protein [Bacteroidota bacterium]
MKVHLSFFSAFVSIVFFIIFSNTTYGQPETIWTKTFGGNGYDRGYSVQQTSDGEYILTGYTSSYGAGGHDVWLIKTDASGDTLWTKTYGGNNGDNGESVKQTSDGGYIIIGDKDGYPSHSDVWLIKTNSDGDTLWTKIYGGNSDDAGKSVQQTSDGGYVLACYTESYGAGYSDFWLIKTDANGDTLWTRTYGGNNSDGCKSVQQTSDGGYIVAGTTESYGSGEMDAWLVKTDASGDTIWTKTFGGDSDDRGWSARQTSDGGYILTGGTASFGAGGEDVWLVKTDASGVIVWEKTFGGNGYDRGQSVEQTTDWGYIITGYNKSINNGIEDIWLIKTNAAGDTVWTKTFGLFGGKGQSVQQNSDGGYIITGGIEYEAGGSDVLLILVAPDTGFIAIEDSPRLYPNSFLLDQNYPNPFNPTTTISFELPMSTTVNLSIYNVTGQLVETLVNEHKNVGYHSVIWNASGVGSGLYFYRIEAGDYSETKKCLILK